jgi:hypothetical protein
MTLKNFGTILAGCLILSSLIESAPLAISANESAEIVKQPVAATIQPKHLPAIGEVGNVIVTYQDGTQDTWTLKGNCMMPKVGPDGQVGWVVCQLLDNDKELKLYRDAPIGSRLAICRKGKILANLQSAKPFIEDWNFAADGSHVVVKSRAAHGVALIELFSIRNGPAEEAVEAYRDGLPEWARPFRDQ